MKQKYTPRVEKVEKVWTPDFKLWVPHDSGEIAFAYLAFGPDNYRKVGQNILSRNLEVPTGWDTASLLYATYCTRAKNEPEFENVQEIIKEDWLWIFNQNLWTDKGVYVVDDIEALGRNGQLKIKDLERAIQDGIQVERTIFSRSGKVRFAPKGSYNFGENTAEALAKDGFVIASCGLEGAKKLGEVSAKFRSKPLIYGFDIQKGHTPELRVSSVDSGCGGLRFGGRGSDGGYAFGVLKE